MPAPVAEPASLVQQLGAVRYADREAAARELERLGRAAVAALESAEIRATWRSAPAPWASCARSRESLLTQPTQVRVDFKEAPLDQVVQALSKRSGMKLALFPPNHPRWNTDHITLDEAAPLPFWKAVDRLCAATGLQYDLEFRGLGFRNEPTLTLTDRGTRVIYPVFDDGPFRVSLVSLEYQHNVGFAILPEPVPARANNRRAIPREQAALRPRAVTSVQCSCAVSGRRRTEAEPEPDRGA